jgi:hypothetical protein
MSLTSFSIIFFNVAINNSSYRYIKLIYRVICTTICYQNCFQDCVVTSHPFLGLPDSFSSTSCEMNVVTVFLSASLNASGRM